MENSNIMKEISDIVSKDPVVLFMKGTTQFPQCGFSSRAVALLKANGVMGEQLKYYNVLANAELREGIKQFSQWPTIPQLYINGEFIGGSDIMTEMHESGELKRLLESV
jgi:monothiol glutaredoxin